MQTTTAPALVSEADFKRSLERLQAESGEPVKGLFGPGSMYWEINRHTLPYFLGAVRAVQYQLAHPWIAVAVFEHSKILSDPRRRAQLTYIYLWSIIYGDLDAVAKKSYSLYRLHARVEGTFGADAGRHAGGAYAANESNALLWVHVTAFYARAEFYEKLVRPLTPEEKDRFCAEAKRYAYCFGIPETAHPQGWAEVEAYIADMQKSGMLVRTDAGVRISRFLRGNLPRPLGASVWAFICDGLPERTRELLDLPADTPGNRARVRRMTAVLRFAQRALPARLAYVPAYHEAQRRLAGKSGPGLVTGILNRLYLGVPRLVS